VNPSRRQVLVTGHFSSTKGDSVDHGRGSEGVMTSSVERGCQLLRAWCVWAAGGSREVEVLMFFLPVVLP